MRPQVVTVSSQATSVPLPVNWRERDFKLGMGVAVTGTLTYSVQHTFDNPQDFTSQTDYNDNAIWYDTDGLTALTANDNGNIVVPVRAVRLNVTAFTSGSATLTVLQAT